MSEHQGAVDEATNSPRADYLHTDGRWYVHVDTANAHADRLIAERDALRAEVERLRKYAPSPEFQALLEASSLGSAEVLALRDTVPDDVARTVVLLARQMERTEAAEAKVAAGLALHYRVPSADGSGVGFWCAAGCRQWPCPTSAALSGGNDQPTERQADPKPREAMFIVCAEHGLADCPWHYERSTEGEEGTR